jgi:hypothetical protein
MIYRAWKRGEERERKRGTKDSFIFQRWDRNMAGAASPLPYPSLKRGGGPVSRGHRNLRVGTALQQTACVY